MTTIDWSIDWLIVFRSIDWLIVLRLIDWLCFDRLIDWLIDWLCFFPQRIFRCSIWAWSSTLVNRIWHGRWIGCCATWNRRTKSAATVSSPVPTVWDRSVVVRREVSRYFFSFFFPSESLLLIDMFFPFRFRVADGCQLFRDAVQSAGRDSAPLSEPWL